MKLSLNGSYVQLKQKTAHLVQIVMFWAVTL